MSDLVDLIQRNDFIKKIFPKGIGDEMFFGQIGLDTGGRICLGIHTKRKPDVIVEKWGAWGDGFNVVVINVIGRSGGSFCIKNHRNMGFAKTIFDQEGDSLVISQAGVDFEMRMSIDYMIFQDCSTYTLLDP
jgi:hypothetical protein